MKLNDTVYFDTIRNSYYRINKQTGKQLKSYKSGQPKKIFKPNITGMDFKIRKSIEKVYQQSPYAINPIKIRKKKEVDRLLFPKFNRTLDHNNSHNQSFDIKSKQLTPTSNISSPRRLASILTNYNNSSSPKNQNSIFLSTITYSSVCQPNNSLSGSKVTLEKEKDVLGMTMKRFVEINGQKKHENNSPKKQQILGNSPQKQYLQTIGLTMKNFKQPYVSKYDRQTIAIIKQYNINQRLPSQYSPKQQKIRQGNTFYKFHPQYVFRQNEASIQKQKDRRKNLKKLQKLYINQKNKNTGQVYQHKNEQENKQSI